MTLYDADALNTALRDLVGWSGDTTGISRTVEAADFPTAIAIVDDVAEAAEAADHHPDIDIRWRKVTFTLSTHSAGGVTQADIDMAHAIDRVIAQHATL